MITREEGKDDKHFERNKKESKINIYKENKLISIDYMNQQCIENLLKKYVNNVNNRTKICLFYKMSSHRNKAKKMKK